jgi:hypothetical protein
METIFIKKKLMQDWEGNEENGYPDPDSNKTKINDTKEPIDVHKNNLKEEIFQIITEKLIEMTQDKFKQNVQEALKKFQNIKNKGYEKTLKQINDS